MSASSPAYRPLRSFAFWCKEHLSQRQFLLLLSLVVGIGAALAAQLLKWLIEHIEFLLTYEFDVSKANWLFLVYPVVGILLSALFIKYVVRDDISHGITKILHAISRRQGHIKRHNTWSSLIASAITIGFGGSVGAESPIVLTGSAIGSNLGEAFKLDHKTLMLLIGCGASAAIAGIFKAPIAGVVFTLEVLMIDLTMASLLPLLIASLTATCVAYALSGTEAMFSFQLLNPFNIERVPSSIILGLCCGLLSLYFTRAMNSFEKFFARFSNIYVKVAIGGVVLAVLIYLFPPLYGEGYETINQILNAENAEGVSVVLNNSLFYGHPEYLLLYLGLILLVKVFATTATNGGGGCGGTFAPSLFLGCIAGFCFSHVWNMFDVFGIVLPERNYALLGMAGLMSGVFHAPLTGVFLIAELTGGYDLFIPLMIVSAVSYLTIHIFEPHSIYAMRLARKGQLLTHHKDQAILTLMSLDAIIEKDAPRLDPDTDLGHIVAAVSKEESEDFAVVAANEQFLGLINLKSLRPVIFRTELYRTYNARQLMRQPEQVLTTDEDMQSVMDKFQACRAESLPVLRPNGTFVGFVSRTKLLESYRQMMKDFSAE